MSDAVISDADCNNAIYWRKQSLSGATVGLKADDESHDLSPPSVGFSLAGAFISDLEGVFFSPLVWNAEAQRSYKAVPWVCWSAFGSKQSWLRTKRLFGVTFWLCSAFLLLGRAAELALSVLRHRATQFNVGRNRMWTVHSTQLQFQQLKSFGWTSVPLAGAFSLIICKSLNHYRSATFKGNKYYLSWKEDTWQKWSIV